MGTMFNDIFTKLLIKVLTNIIGEPEYWTINNIILYLYGIADMLLATLSGGQHGHISLIKRLVVCATLSQVPNTDPEGSVTIPNVPPGITDA